MEFKHRMIVFEAADLHAESAFWAGLLDGTVVAGDRWHNIWVDGTWQLGVQLAPGHVPPAWPDDASPQQIHLDFYLEDLESGHQKVLDLGGRLLQTTDEFRVYADPAGHPFCLCRLRPQGGS